MENEIFLALKWNINLKQNNKILNVSRECNKESK